MSGDNISRLVRRFAPEYEGGLSRANPNLSDLSLTEWRPLNGIKGERLLYRRAGSSPGGALELRLDGREVGVITPGTQIHFPFTKLEARLTPWSARAGACSLITFLDPFHTISEVDSLDSVPVPVSLVGSKNALGIITFQAVAENGQPSGAQTGSFSIAGYKQLRIWLDGQAANTMTSVTLIPWFTLDSDDGVWAEDGQSILNVPDSQGSAYRYRVFTMNLNPIVVTTPQQDPRMFLEVRALLPAAQTQIGMFVEGIG